MTDLNPSPTGRLNYNQIPDPDYLELMRFMFEGRKRTQMMVYIPFQEKWRVPMLKGLKTCTSRPKRACDIGNTFNAFGAVFRVIDIQVHQLIDVATNLYLEEGCTTPLEFKQVWEDIHPIKGFVSEWKVYVHHFKREV